MPFEDLGLEAQTALLRRVFDDSTEIEWSEEDVVLLHWKLLQQLADLSKPKTPMFEKIDILRWVFTDRSGDAKPFSFVNCVKVVSSSPLSPTPYFGATDVEQIRDWIRYHAHAWFGATLERFPAWIRDAIVQNPDWIERKLVNNPQWLNEQIKQHTVNSDLFA